MIKVSKPFTIFVLAFNLIACTFGPSIPPEATATELTGSFTPYVAGMETALADLSPTPCVGCTETAIAASSPTPWVAGTETALAGLSPTPWVAGTDTALAVSSASPTSPPIPTFTPAALPFPTFTPFPLPKGTFTPVFYGTGPFLLLGGVKKDHGWLTGVQAAQFISSLVNYDFFSPNESTQVQGNSLEFSPTCGNHYMNSSVVMPEPMVGVASGWISEKRVTRDLSTDDPAYMQAVTEWFQSQGNAPTEIHITRILQADIEGDGVNEVLLSASYFKNESFTFLTETGDYSVVLMRKMIGNSVLTVPLVKEYYVSSVPEVEISYPYTYTLVEAVDLNGDGTLEVIVDVRRWEGGGAIVYRVDGQNVREVLRVIC